MKKAIKNLISKTDLKILFTSSLLVILFYGINYSIEYATDTYSTFEEIDTWKWMLYENGRVFNAALYYIIENSGISNGIIYKLSYFLALFCLSSAVYLFAYLLHEFCNNQILCSFISFLTLSNFFIIEYFLFIEKGLFMLAILLCTIAVYFTIRFFKTRQRLFILLSFLALLWAVSIYQIILAIYVILCLPFILKYSHNIKEFLLNNLLAAALYGTPLLLSFVILKFLLGSSRMGNVTNIFSNLFEILPVMITIHTKQWFHVPKYLFLFF